MMMSDEHTTYLAALYGVANCDHLQNPMEALGNDFSLN